MHDDVDRARLIATVEYFFPGIAAVLRTENTAFRISGPEMSNSCHKNRVGIAWIDQHFANMMRVGEPFVLP